MVASLCGDGGISVTAISLLRVSCIFVSIAVLFGVMIVSTSCRASAA